MPVFFVLHGYTANYNVVPAKEAFLLCLKYLAFTLLLALVFFILYKDFIKAGLVAFSIMIYNLFFGNIHDLFKSIFKDSLVTKYGFIFTATIIFFILFIIWLKKNKKNLVGIIKYLNWLFLLFIILDTANLALKIIKKKKPEVVSIPKDFTDCDTCYKPDIYLIVADEYANTRQLKETLNFDNSAFERDLKNRGFHIIENARSNYNSTPFSIASLMTMNYIDYLGNKFDDNKLNKAYAQINENVLTRWLQRQNYQIKNHSVFHFDNIPNPVNSSFFITGTDLFTSKTLLARFNKDLRFNFITRFKIKSEINKFVQDKLDKEAVLINKTIKEVNRKSDKPRFVYLHTMMPHFPYLMDKDGNADYSASFLESNRFNQAGYIGYLQYSNKIFLQLIDKIQSASPTAIIIFMGDHGFRHLEGNNSGHFMNFNSIYLPDKNYSRFYDGMSLVNEFRILLNTQFNQHLPILKDSTIFLQNWW